MGGGGFLYDMIHKLRENERILKKSNRFRNHRDEYYRATIGTPVNFKTATKEQLAEIRAKVVEERKREAKKRIFILIISIPIAAICVYFIAEYFSLWLQRRF